MSCGRVMGSRGLVEQGGMNLRTQRAEAQKMDDEKRHQCPPERLLLFSHFDPSAHHGYLSLAFLEGNPCASERS